MKNKKRIFFTLLAALLGAMCFTSCGGAQETFQGKLSDKSFESENAALTAFLEDEIEGLSTQAELVEYVKDADLDQKEIAALPLGDIAPEEVSHAERGTISYRATMPQNGIALTSDAENIKTHEIYLLELDGKFRYLVPPTQIGQPITKDYFDDIFSSEKYTNFTIEYRSSAKGTYNGSTQNVSSFSTYNFTENALKFTQQDSSFGGYTLECYIVERNGKFFGCTPNNISAYDATVPNYNSGAWHIEAIDTKGVDVQIQTLGDFRYLVTAEVTVIDFSFFEKTKNGFGIMSAEKFLKIAQKMIGESDLYKGMKECLKEFKYECVVRDGRLDKIESSMRVDGSVSIGETQQELKGEQKESWLFDQFGTTEITLPEELQQQLEKL